MKESALAGEYVLIPGSEDVTVTAIEGMNDSDAYIVRELEKIEGEYEPRRYAVQLRDATPEDRQRAAGIIPDTAKILHVGAVLSRC